MTNESLTLFIPLYGKAMMSREGFLPDPTAEEIVATVDYDFSKVDQSRKLAIYMAMRAALYDGYVREFASQHPDGLILQLGVGLDSRVKRVPCGNLWFDLDFPEVIDQRKRYFRETENYRMIGADVMEEGWLKSIPGKHAIVVMEGISMYLPEAQLESLLDRLCTHFESVSLLMDCYTTFAAKASKVKNPINDVGVTQVYGMDDPKVLETEKLRYVCEREMTPADLITELPKGERWIFRKLYAGDIARKMYRMYEFER